MNKILAWIRNITFIIVMILLFMSFTGISSLGMTNMDYHLWFAVLLIIIFIQLIILLCKHSECNLDNRYSLLMIGANIIFIVIYLRTMFDINIVTTYIGSEIRNDLGYRYTFLNANLPLLTLIYTILFIYPLTYIKLKIKKDAKLK